VLNTLPQADLGTESSVIIRVQ